MHLRLLLGDEPTDLRSPRTCASEEAAVVGPRSELVAVGQLQLAQHRRDVGLDGLHGEVQLLGDLPVRVAVGDEAHHLLLVVRPAGRVPGRPAWAALAGERVEDETVPGAVIEHRVAGVDPVDLVDGADPASIVLVA